VTTASSVNGEAARLAVFRRGLEARLGAGLEIPDMPAQCRGRRDAQNVIETVGPTPVENLGTAIVTVGAQQDLGLWPVGADCPQQAAQEGANLLAAGPFGGTKNGGDKAALAIEHDDRLKAVFVVMCIEQPQLLAAMNRVERVVDVERDPFGNPLEGLAIKIDHGAAHAQQAASIGQVFKTGDGRLRTQFAFGRRQIERHLEDGIASQRTGVVAVFIAGADHKQTKPDDLGERVRNQLGRARVNHAGGEPIGNAKALLDPDVYEFLEAEQIKYAIRLPANRVLQNRIGYLLGRPDGKFSKEVRKAYDECMLAEEY
jgi:hypothetical protein